jgi:uncharacterized protein with ParB-like and HNH nuclease domain
VQTELLSISKIFTETLFRIPDYQRGYAWRDKQLKDFWNDIVHLENGKNHYTGVLTLEDVSPSIVTQWTDDLWIIESKHYSPYYVVDGQQRLTTTIVLIQAILELVAAGKLLNYTTVDDIRRKFIFESKDGGISRSYIFGYEKDNPSYEFLKTSIFTESSDNHSTSEHTIYTHNLAAAKAFFLEKLRELTHDGLEKIYTKVTQHLLFNIYAISKDIDVCVAFETMNNRGKPLSHLELLKNRLIYLSMEFPTDQNERTKLRSVINESWKSAYHFLGKNEKRPLDDDHFLETHFFLYFGKLIGKDDTESGYLSFRRHMRGEQYKEYLLEEVFAPKRLREVSTGDDKSLTVATVYDYAHHVKICVELYHQMFNPADGSFSDPEKIELERIRRLGHPHAPGLLIALYLTEKSRESRLDVLRELERTLFVAAAIPYVPGIDELDFRFLSIQLITGRVDAAGVGKNLRQHSDKRLAAGPIVSALTYRARESGFYGWRMIKYFMFEYEQELLGRSKTNREKLNWERFVTERFEEDYESVEHIYPQKVIGDCWRAPFSKYTIKERNTLRNSLGNLVPLSVPKNSALGNKCFDDKKGSVEKKTGYRYGCYSEIEVAQNSEWTAKEILARGLRLLDFMEKRWGFILGTPPERVKALGLGFVTKKEGGL